MVVIPLQPAAWKFLGLEIGLFICGMLLHTYLLTQQISCQFLSFLFRVCHLLPHSCRCGTVSHGRCHRIQVSAELFHPYGSHFDVSEPSLAGRVCT